MGMCTFSVWTIGFAIALMGAAPALALDGGATKTAILEGVAETYQPREYANHVWTMVAAALVLAMQAGFLMLEAGLSRTASAINVAMKNLIDFIVAVCFFYLIGFGLMFGDSLGGWVGGSLFAPNTMPEPWFYTFFVFQMMFAGTAATIVAGAVAERTRIYAYLIMTVVCLTLYTTAGHWVWGNLYNPSNTAWLAERGFVDFAGSTVVHSVGGWLALAGAIIVGARQGRFGDNPKTFQPNNAAWATLGTLLLWIGWIGFNGGSTTAATPEFAHIIANTMLAGAFGGLVYMLIGVVEDRGILRPERSITGVLAGLVAVTAGCQVLDQQGAVFVGLGGGVVAWLATHLLAALRIDDVVAAAPVHGFAGAWGTLALAGLAPTEALPAGTVGAQLAVQALGVGVYFAWTFGVGFVVLWMAHRIWCAVETAGGKPPQGFRVTPETEARGLNVEHGVTLGTAVVQDHLHRMVDEGRLREDIQVDPGDENAEIANLVNRLRQSMLAVIDGIASNADALAAAAERVIGAAEAVGQQAADTRAHAKTAESATTRAAQANDIVQVQVQRLETELARVTNKAGDIADRVSNASRSAADIRAVAERADTRADATRAEVARASSTSADADARIRALEDLARQIDGTANVIADVAKHTHMVALNATIEASQAGETGKSFAVVAEEVKNLSNKVDRAARDIGDLARQIATGTGEAADATRNIATVISSVEDAIGHTVEVAAECTRLANGIEASLQETGTAALEVAGSARTVQSTAAEVRERAAGAAAEGNAVSEEMVAVHDGATRNDDLARNLNQAATDIRARIVDLRRMRDAHGA